MNNILMDENFKKSTIVIDGQKKSVGDILKDAKESLTFEEWSKFLILNETVIFVENVCHFMTDLIYISYHLSNSEVINEKEKNQLDITQEKFKKQVKELQEKLSKVIFGSDIGTLQNSNHFKKLVDKKFIKELFINTRIISTICQNDSKELSLQIHNSLMGLFNLYNFMKKLRSQNKAHVTKAQLDVLTNALSNDMIPCWNAQLDLLNRFTFNRLIENKSVIKEYTEKTNNTNVDVTSGEGFKSYINWLQDTIIGVGSHQSK
ncbi:hypothetical protein Kpol_1010p36 [Vanderwaltozyma polyspora DSM 70294]|uniref:Uncharacterized protein n=1 Tax=Vanderwaltozyma polyspora (strain ATCC 22028 / DSM 70294 / BCRC 21397 / CBS 2163 / NBRC 10782 / NRRL Y-8283 / UCD 57-17) TaxID=436907 RepID=A7TII2_VANPO|nr:uncharacterized protein Kpol_1010p36 [Vanderwaltozyma polyspora DSM 70294]EDO17920.1 hypothetical protein Kpol_1010p36 [Vanderwaltozyma polyspora DSM 70294]